MEKSMGGMRPWPVIYDIYSSTLRLCRFKKPPPSPPFHAWTPPVSFSSLHKPTQPSNSSISLQQTQLHIFLIINDNHEKNDRKEKIPPPGGPCGGAGGGCVRLWRWRIAVGRRRGGRHGAERRGGEVLVAEIEACGEDWCWEYEGCEGFQWQICEEPYAYWLHHYGAQKPFHTSVPWFQPHSLHSQRYPLINYIV